MRVGNTGIAAAVIGLSAAALTMPPAISCETVAGWKAPLSGKNLVPAMQSSASGIASFDFALDQPQATVTLDTSGLKDVTEIDLRHGFVGGNGPVVARLYRAQDGDLPAHLVKTMTAADVPVNASLRVRNFTDFVMMIINGGVYMQVYTRTHPEGELRGQVTMIKQRVYSSAEDGKGHDPSLHAKFSGSRPSHAPSTRSAAQPQR